MRVLPSGADAVLVELDELADVLGLDAALAGASPTPLAGGALAAVTETVPGARTLLVRFDPRLTDAASLTRELLDTPWAPTQLGIDAGHRPDAAPIEIPTSYDGSDLADVARQAGLSPPEVIAAHSASVWTVGFIGFAPGFPYLVGGDPRLRVARRATPRVRVEAGSVALAGEYCGIYPTASPGGWQIIGRTEVALWDLARQPPALLSPGTRVRFVAREPAEPEH